MKSVLFRIGKFEVHGYGLMIALGIIAAYLVTEYRAKRRGLEHERILTLTVWCAVGGMLGAKLLYYLVEIDEVIKNPSMLLDIGGGFVVYGGIILGILAGFLYCRWRKMPFLTYFDLVMPAIALAQGFGRIGCFLGGCCYGVETTAAWGVIFPSGVAAPAGVKLVPIQLVSSALDFLNFGVLVLLSGKFRKDGQIAGLYLAFYSAGRFAVEFGRGDIERGAIGALSTSQFISIFTFAAGLFVFFFFTYREEIVLFLCDRLGIRRAAYRNASGDRAYSNAESAAPSAASRNGTAGCGRAASDAGSEAANASDDAGKEGKPPQNEAKD